MTICNDRSNKKNKTKQGEEEGKGEILTINRALKISKEQKQKMQRGKQDKM